MTTREYGLMITGHRISEYEDIQEFTPFIEEKGLLFPLIVVAGAIVFSA